MRRGLARSILPLLLCCLLTSSCPSPRRVPLLSSARAESPPSSLGPEDIRAESAILIEANTGEVVFEKNADDLRFPASTTKILTIFLGVLMGNADDVVTVSPSSVLIPEDSSKIGLKEGEQLRFSDLLKATMVSSGNDGANVIAEHISGSQDAFAAMMNDATRSFGCSGTHFVNAHGYHNDYHYSTARDLAVIAREAMKNEEFRAIALLSRFTLPRNNLSASRALTAGHMEFLTETENASRYYPYANGIKTGYHSQAGYCFVGSAVKDGISLISVVLKTSSAGRWADTKKLMEYGFSQYISTSIEEIYKKDPKIIDISAYELTDENMGRLELAIRKVDPVANDHLIGLAGRTDSWTRTYNSRTQIEYTRVLEAPVSAGEVVGTLTYTPEDGVSAPVEYELIATRGIRRRASIAPSLAEIQAYTSADPNPFPRFSLEFLFLMLLPVISVAVLSQLIYRLLTRKRKPRIKRRASYKARYYR